MPRPSGRRNGQLGRGRAGGAGSSRCSSGCGRARTGRSPAAAPATPAASPAHSQTRAACRSAPGCRRRRRRSRARRRGQLEPCRHGIASRAARRSRLPRLPALSDRSSSGQPEQYRVERDRERERRARQERRAGEQSDEPRPLPPNSSIRQANVRMVAMSWPVCQTPPRVVTHRICVENPNRAVSQARSAVERRRPDRAVHQHIPTDMAARIALIPGLHLVGPDRPGTATSGMSTIAGNGANGT